ncbi:MAG: thiamine phosphate synthase [Abitibacteriaceae bacterium]|nr:thiamine phosphate synthase [Abditibacteriaceae bacterium]
MPTAFPSTQNSLPPHLLRPRLQGLYVITDERMGGGHLAIARAALDGGAAIIQLRDKTSAWRQLLVVAHELRHMTRAAGALFFVNDRVDLALAAQADGVHLGPDDMPVKAAHRILGPHRLIGASCATPDEARAATLAGADYIAAGAIFGTSTKSDAGAAIGVAMLGKIKAATSLPVAAIGGINRDNITAISLTAVPMACVISAVAKAGDEAAMTAATRELVQKFTSNSTPECL